MRKILIALAALVVLLVVAALGAFFYVKGSGKPSREGEVTVAGLGSTVEIRYDRWGVPHIKADNEADLAAGVGYAQANDRMTQLELGRRSCTGRLAELIGDAAVELDRRSRMVGLRRGAEALEKAASDRSRLWASNFARGVNAWLEARDGDLPPELRIVGAEVDPWTPVDTYCFAMIMARDLSFPGGLREDARFRLVKGLGVERAVQLFGGPDTHLPFGVFEQLGIDTAGLPRPAVPVEEGEGDPADAGPTAEDEVAGLLWEHEYPPVGSNNWAVGSSRSATGAPLVVNDPHLPMSLPSIWFEMVLRAPGIEVAGMGIPGIPTVVVGQTRHLAWSVTNTELDDHDLFVEELDPTGTKVRRGDSWVDIEVTKETILKRDGEEVEVEIRWTDRGPLLPANETAGLPPRSLVWTAHLPADPFAAFLNLAEATTLEEVPEAISSYVAPAQNLVLAHRDGGLLYTLLAGIPERKTGDGKLYSPGWDEAYGWTGLRPWQDNPRSTSDDLLVTANDDIRPEGYALPVNADFAPGYRAARIRERLVGQPTWDVASMAALQTDTVSLFARDFVAWMKDDYEGDAGKAYAALADWDGSMDMTGPAALFVLFAREANLATFFDEARSAEMRPFTGVPHLRRLMAGQMDPSWFDDVRTADVVEDRKAILSIALEKAWQAGFNRWGGQVEAWNYGILHPLIQRHPLGALPGLGGMFNLGPEPVGGSPFSILAFGGRWTGAQQQTVGFGPSMRWIADLADPDRSQAMLPSGQSGHPWDAHYGDQMKPFLAGETRPVAFTEEAIQAATVSTVVLKPQ